MTSAEPLRFCVVGYGSIGRRHAANALSLGSDAFFLRSGEAVEGRPRLEKQIPVVFDRADVAALNPDAVIVANPTFLHLETTRWALEQGFDVLIEKPLSHSVAGLSKLHSLAREQNAIVGVAHQMRFDKRLLRMKEVLDSGAIGQVTTAHVEWGTHLPDWHPWEDYRTGYAARRDMGGGVTLTCSHELNTAEFLFGKIEEVLGQRRKLESLQLDAEGCMDGLLSHEGGCTTLLHLDFFQKPNRRRIRAIGELGSVVWDFEEPNLEITADCAVTEDGDFPSPYPFEDDYIGMLADFSDAVRDRKDPLVTLTEGERTTRVALALLESAETNSMIKLPRSI